MIVSAINPGAAGGPPGTGSKGSSVAAGEEPGKGGRKKKLLLALAVVVLVAAAAWWFLLRPGDAADAPPEPGEVVSMEPIQVNLTGGHYLKVGIALQLTADAHEADGSKALDATIALFSGQDVARLGDPAQRAELKEKLVETLQESYHGDVMEVYFTEFVTQ